MTERTANQALESTLEAQAAERARWAAVLAKPATATRRTVRRPSLLARIVALFA